MKELLPFNTNPPFPVQARGNASDLKPLSLQIAAKPYGASGVSIWVGEDSRKEERPFQFAKKNLLCTKVFKEFFLQPYVVRATGDTPG